jgi:glycerophosphoryl diester phosphodiesterase
VTTGEVLAGPFAHRGLHGPGRPENTIAAFEAAVAAGFGIELDVRLSADGLPVVFHDATLARLCGDGRRLSALTAAELFRTPVAGSDQTVPTLAAVLSLVGGRTPLMVDVKAGLVAPERRRTLADGVAILLRSYVGPVAVVGFDALLLGSVAATAPRVVRGQSAGVDPAFVRRWWARAACRPVDDLWSARLSRPQFVTFNVDRLPSALVARIRESMPIVAWTVRTSEQLATARRHADGMVVEVEAVAGQSISRGRFLA